MITNLENAEHYRWGAVCEGWRLLERADLTVIRERIPPGAGEVQHFHARARQLFFVLSGALEIELGEQRFRVGAEDALEVSPGVLHRVSNSGPADAVFLVISAPTTRGDRTNVEA